MGNNNIRDPFASLYGDIQDIWNEKKGLDYMDNDTSKKRIIKKLKIFANFLPEKEGFIVT